MTGPTLIPPPDFDPTRMRSPSVDPWPRWLEAFLVATRASGATFWVADEQSRVRLIAEKGYRAWSQRSAEARQRLAGVLAEVLRQYPLKFQSIDVEPEHFEQVTGRSRWFSLPFPAAGGTKGLLEFTHLPDLSEDAQLQIVETAKPFLQSAYQWLSAGMVPPLPVSSADFPPSTQGPTNAFGAPPAPPAPPAPFGFSSNAPFSTAQMISAAGQVSGPSSNTASTAGSTASVAGAAPVSVGTLLAAGPEILEALLNLQRGLDLNELGEALVNDCRVLFGSDRVALVSRRGKSVAVVAVSGQEGLQRRSETIKSLAALSRRVLEGTTPLRYEGTAAELPPALEELLTRFAEVSGARLVWVLPLVAPHAAARSDQELKTGQSQPASAIGALVIEQMGASSPTEKLLTRVDLMLPHIGAAVANAQTHSWLWGMSVWRTIGRVRNWFFGRRLAWAGVVAAASALLAVALVIVPYDYRVEARGRLVPAMQQDIFAPSDGQVLETLVKGGDRVVPGTVLVRLKNDELETDRVSTRNQLAQQRQLLASLRAQQDTPPAGSTSADEIKLQGKVEETRVLIKGLAEQLQLLDQRTEKLTVVTPVGGVVATFQIEKLLRHRPVRRGELLVQVMEDQGPWHLELDLEEQRLGHVLAAQGATGPDLPIDYRLLTRPETTFQARLSEVGSRAVSSEELGNVVELIAALDESSPPPKTIGAEVRARVGCGKKPLGYVLFGDVIEFAQRYLWY